MQASFVALQNWDVRVERLCIPVIRWTSRYRLSQASQVRFPEAARAGSKGLFLPLVLTAARGRCPRPLLKKMPGLKALRSGLRQRKGLALTKACKA